MSTPSNEPSNPYSQGGPSYDSGSFNQPPQFPGYTPGGDQGQFQGQNPAGYQYPGGYMPSPQQLEGAQLAQTSMILGILSLFIVGIILGPIAIVKANRAEREFHTSATVGKVTGWIGTILGALWILWVGFVIIAAFGAYSFGY